MAGMACDPRGRVAAGRAAAVPQGARAGVAAERQNRSGGGADAVLAVRRPGSAGAGHSTKLDYAAESWRKAGRLARQVEDLAAEIPAKGGIRKANGEQVLWRADEVEQVLDEGSR
ncbi:hypothetical protein [Amycolatopsis sp. A1MSW2902]|uniref:hypothetical protein n=1 Tax=Amycolatopsis sp. A1MSW2902 TaxID=687413 RepID=UPI00307FA164